MSDADLMSVREYLGHVYPLGKNDMHGMNDQELINFFNGLTFYYKLDPSRYVINPPIQGDYVRRNTERMPAIGELYSPAIINPVGFVCRNVYPAIGPLNNVNRNGYSSGSDIEICHSNVYNGTLGIYYYLAKGSGIFVNIGKTLVANNKLHALRLLGQTNEQIADLLYSRDTGYWPAYYKGELPPSSQKAYFNDLVRQYMIKHACSKEQAENGVIDAAINETDYLLGRLNDTGWAIDVSNFNLGRSQGYDTIQLTTQANMNNGWAFEIIDLRVKGFTLEDVMAGLAQYQSIRNPFNPSEAQTIKNTWPYYNLYCEGTMSEIAKHYPSYNGRFVFPGPGFFTPSKIPSYPA